MTKKSGRSAENDPGLSALLNSKAPAICLVGKTWDFHVDVALGISKEENLENIVESTKHFVKENKEFMFDAEHFFDGFKNNKDYAISCVKSAYDNGARWIVLCDTNGGTLPDEVEKIVKETTKHIPGKNLGIHAHNDTGNAVANSERLIRAGADAVKLEGRLPDIIRAIIKAGIPVMGHLGLLPQTAKKYTVQGKTEEDAKVLLADAKALQEAGVFSIVLEMVAAETTKHITEAVYVPTIGIGSGKDSDGQVLVIQDMLGLNEKMTPKFVKKYLSLS